MEKKKNIITGILSVAVFIMAVQVGVAQEKVQASSDNVEVKGSIETRASAKMIENPIMDIQGNVVFTYNPPSGSFPYADAKVKNTANWSTGSACDDESDQQVACSISVPFANTMTGGSQIDPNKVTIHTVQFGPAIDQNYGVSPSPNSQYLDPINKPLTTGD